MLASIPIGNEINLRAEFTDDDTGLPATPTAVRFRLTDPYGVEKETLTADVQDGIASATYLPTMPGLWQVRVEADDPNSAQEDEFRVRPTTFSNPQ